MHFWELADQIGGAFNGFAPLALIFAIITLKSQMDQFEETMEQTKQQAFESSFYSMVEHLDTLIDNINFETANGEGEITGRRLLRKICSEHVLMFSAAPCDTPDEAQKAAIDYYRIIHAKYRDVISCYFRLFGTIVEHITQSRWLQSKHPRSRQELEHRYFGILRSHLTADEQYVLLLHLLSGTDEKLFQSLRTHRLILFIGLLNTPNFQDSVWKEIFSRHPINEIAAD